MRGGVPFGVWGEGFFLEGRRDQGQEGERVAERVQQEAIARRWERVLRGGL